MATQEPGLPENEPSSPVDKGGVITLRRPVFLGVLLGVVLVTTLVAVGGTAAVIGRSDELVSSSSSVVEGTSAVTGENPTNATTSESTISRINQPVTNGSVRFTLLSAERPSSVEKYRSDDTGYGYVFINPKSGAKFILIKASLENVGRVPLTPQNAVNISVGDEEDRFYTPVDENYGLKANLGNDSMPDDLQPGFATDIWYLFEVPKNSAIWYTAIADQEISRPVYSYIALPQKL